MDRSTVSINRDKRRWWLLLVFIAVLLGMWELIVVTWNIPAYLLPRPSIILHTFIDNSRGLMSDLLVTSMESIAGFVLAAFVAFVAAIVFTYSKVMHNLFMPFFISLKAVPLIAIAPMLVIWFGNGFLSKMVMVSIVCFFPIVVNMTRGLRDVPQEHIDLFKTLGAKPYQFFLMVRLPNSMPFFFAALKISSALSVIGAIVAEFAGANQGIGYVILVAALRTDIPLLFCGTILASLLGLVLYYTLEVCEPWCIFWENVDE